MSKKMSARGGSAFGGKKIIAFNLALAFLLAGFFCWTDVQKTVAAEISTNASAEVAIGQPDFTSSSANPTAANTVSLINGIWSDGQKLIMADLYNSRVLIFNSIPTANNANADVVVGQPDMNTGSLFGSAATNRLGMPYSVFSDGIRLFIADSQNNRVLIYNSIPTVSDASADVVVGQPDLTSNGVNQGGGYTAGAGTLFFPQSVYSDGKKLFIADTGNSRVLVFNSIPTTNGVSADFAIGQADLTSNSENRGGSAGANTLSEPTSVFAHSGKLFIADDENNRVLIFNSIPTAGDASANVVVGQTDFSGINENQGASPGANTIDDPISVTSDGIRLIVSERDNNRILIFNSIPTANNASANLILGQPDFQSNSANQGGSARANTLKTQGSAYFAAGKLFVGDAMNARALIFSMDAASVWKLKKSMNFYGGIKGKLKKKTVSFNGKKTDAKKGRVHAYQNGVLKKSVKIKKSGAWKFSFKDSQRSVNKLFQFRFYNSAGQLVSISDAFNVYLSSSNKVKSASRQIHPMSNSEAQKSAGTGTSAHQDFSWTGLPESFHKN